MRHGTARAQGGFAALALAAALATAQSSTPARPTPAWAGTWEGKVNGLPGITLTIDDAGGKIAGSVVFYLQKRADVNAPWRVTGQDSKPLVAPRVEGNTLTFEVQHQVCDGCTERGPNARFRVALAGPNEARIWKLDGRGADSDPGSAVKLVRQAGLPQP